MERTESSGEPEPLRSSKDLIREIDFIILRNAIAIERAERILEVSALRRGLAQERLRESNKRVEQACKVLKQAGLLR